MKAFAVAILPLVLGVHPAQAATYPTELQGIWVPQDEGPKVKRACDSFRKSGEHPDGMLIFEKTEMSAYGGYADYTDKNISVKKIGPSRWKIADRHYHDGEGDDRPGMRTVRYEVVTEGDLLKIKDKYGVHRYTRCPQQSPVPQGEMPKD
jgi:hypothetical protein